MTMRRVTMICLCTLLAGVPGVRAQQPTRQEVEELKKMLQKQEESIRALKTRIQQLEGHVEPAAKAKGGAPAVATPGGAPPAVVAQPAEPTPATGEAPSPAEVAETKIFGKRSKEPKREQMDDRQEAAAQPGDYVMDPTYRGYIPIPATIFMVKFNPKPRLDLLFTTSNPGDVKYRFAPESFPLKSSGIAGGEQFNATANGSQIRVDMRAPTMPGNFRLYYQNDFFGSDTAQMRYRLQHFFGQYYGLVGGFTYGVFEDPDAWPDTVDYEGPNAVIFARRPLLHYVHEFFDDWAVTFGLEDPSVAIDTTGIQNAAVQTRAPDGGFNIRWTPGDIGHVQFGTLLRSLGVRGDNLGKDNAIGWGASLSGALDVTASDTMQFWGVYGEGIGGLGNDSGFQNTDAAFDSHGNIVPLEYVSGMGALTHKWTPRWRSTATFGYVKVGNTSMQVPTAYHLTRYGSLNLVYQVFKRVSVGVEGLYGFREAHNGDESKDVVRVNLGVVYSPFD